MKWRREKVLNSKWRREKVLNSMCTILLSFLLVVPSVDAQDDHPQVLARVKETLTVKGKIFKDLNSNGKLDDYENWGISVEKRVD